MPFFSVHGHYWNWTKKYCQDHRISHVHQRPAPFYFQFVHDCVPHMPRLNNEVFYVNRVSCIFQIGKHIREHIIAQRIVTNLLNCTHRILRFSSSHRTVCPMRFSPSKGASFIGRGCGLQLFWTCCKRLFRGRAVRLFPKSRYSNAPTKGSDRITSSQSNL